MSLFSGFETDFKITNVFPQGRVLLYILVGYGLCQTIFYFSTGFWQSINAYAGLGLTFAIAISTMLSETRLRIVLFLSLSTLLYFLMVRLALVQAYFSANLFFVVLASVSGAILETLLFCTLFQCLGYLSYLDIFFVLLCAALAIYVLTFVTFPGKEEFVGILIWQLAVGYIFTRIYTRKIATQKPSEHP
ncbi:hypothetical protein QNI19_30015 [Cytophagaceae bacterium DM2B3-1]|uniref:Uncharacterized protein n=1 Tax=Xanthocytophaga flava TaxID=3048013 RepID=A0ABT7CWA3_9BACT|nr:hypothetical protein [Xanthocytophaga flavus]MDJ1472565.1 hypothetical protein [Xanthocytophaga flavus]MDJ1497212.1 hypothetical protein [Xanthocytophaga flavus]